MKVFALLMAMFVLTSWVAAVKDEICDLPIIFGDCRALFPRFTYKADSNECVGFLSGECDGNQNNFLTKEECEEKCKE